MKRRIEVGVENLGEALDHFERVWKRAEKGAIANPKLVVTRRSGEAILKQTRADKPGKALRKLMRDRRRAAARHERRA